MYYKPKGVCSQQIHFDIIDNKVRNVSFVGGCNGCFLYTSDAADD